MRRQVDQGPPLTAERFASQRAETLKHLVRVGVPVWKAKAWVAAWDESTAPLRDFRRAPDFWDLGYLFALEEYRRGHVPRGQA